MVARDGHVVEKDLAVRGATDSRPLAGGMERLPCPAAARTHDERRALEPVQQVMLVLPDLVGGERLRGLRGRVALVEQGAAARAVVRRLRVQESALGAIDMAHGPSPV